LRALSAKTPDASFLRATLLRVEAVGLEQQALLLRRGPTPGAILYIAEQEQVDLVIVVSQAKPAFFLDSMASAVVQLAPCSVLVVRPKTGPLPGNGRT
jgi:nucleotide-binding universal stress UspA family protein